MEPLLVRSNGNINASAFLILAIRTSSQAEKNSGQRTRIEVPGRPRQSREFFRY